MKMTSETSKMGCSTLSSVAFWCVFGAAATLSTSHAQTVEPVTPGSVAAAAGQADPLALRMELRLRYTNIDQSDKPLNVDVTTVRAVAGFSYAFAPNLRLTAELIHTDFIGPKRFDDGSSFGSPYPFLPDPRYTGLNTATLTWQPTESLEIKAGRQAVKLGNERHVSNDSFRNIPQLFDGVMVNWSPMQGAMLNAGHFVNMRSRFGPLQRANLSVFEFAMNPMENVSTTAYAIRHNPDAVASNAFLYGIPDVSNVTFGGTADANWNVGGVRLDLKAELAKQRAISTGSPLIAANYYRVGAGAGLNGWVVRADHENRASNQGKYGFQTILTDLYAYNGNALVFFANPKEGLRDSWATLRWEGGPWSMLHEYHWFRSDALARSLGRELDLNFTYHWSERGYARAQWAHYRHGEKPQPDIDKVWITLGYAIK
jgi:hypothetical protein